MSALVRVDVAVVFCISFVSTSRLSFRALSCHSERSEESKTVKS